MLRDSSHGAACGAPDPDHVSLVTRAGRPFDRLYDPFMPLRQWGWANAEVSSSSSSTAAECGETSNAQRALYAQSALYAQVELHYHTPDVVFALDIAHKEANGVTLTDATTNETGARASATSSRKAVKNSATTKTSTSATELQDSD